MKKKIKDMDMLEKQAFDKIKKYITTDDHWLDANKKQKYYLHIGSTFVMVQIDKKTFELFKEVLK